MARRTTGNFRPRLDRLERRECPTVDVVQRGVFLYVTGDSADDWVAVCDEGSQKVEVQTGRGAELFQGVKWVVGNLGEGNDTFEFHQASSTDPSNSLVVKVDLAAGDDRFLYRTPPSDSPRPDPNRPAKYSLDVRGGVGNDVMVIGPEYVPGLELDLQFDLGAGNDTFAASYKRDPAMPVGIIIPCVSLDVATGEGNDRVTVAVANPNDLDPLHLEDLRVGVHGSGGDTSAVLGYANVAVTRGLMEVIDLGGGADSIVSTFSNFSVGGTLKLSITGGGGDDEVGIIINGGQFGAVSQKVNVGEGDDIVSVSWKRSEVFGPAMTRLSLAEGDDQVVITVEGDAHFAGPVTWAMDAGVGDDSASVLIEDSENLTAFEGPLTLRLGLGTGDDSANVMVRDANDMAGPLTVAVDGGGGDDGIVSDVDFTPRTRTSQLDPGNAPAAVLVDLCGGEGLDTIDAYTEGEWRGIAGFRLRGAAGDDALGFHGTIGDGSAGTLAVDMDGGAGKDLLAANLLIPVEQVVPIYMRLLGGFDDDVLAVNLLGGPDTTPEPHLFLVDGGRGFDLAHAPSVSIVRNCEGRF